MSVLVTALATQLSAGPASASDLMRALGVSQPTVSRAVTVLQREGRAIKMGSTRSARYGLLRNIPGVGSSWPVFQVHSNGTIHDLGWLHALERQHYYCDCKPVHLHGLTDSLPYFLQDQRPAGFLERSIPAAYPELALPSRVGDWTDNHYLTYLTRRGSDCVGDLIVGTEAFDRYLQALRNRTSIAAANRASVYPELASNALSGDVAGSPAHGEHPKFTALVDHGDHRTHVIVKFSPPLATPAGQRWSDLLVAEHLAHRHLNASGIASCRSEVLRLTDRTYLEVERFDRVGDEGRHGVVSFLAIDTARYGQLDRWSKSAQRLGGDGLLSTVDVDQIRLLEAFGAMTANTDRHFGNLALFDRYAGHYGLAPVYDMLPMLFAPQNDQLIERSFEPPDPTVETLAVWSHARELAESYWALLIADTRISSDFRGICERVLVALRTSPQRAAPR
jgi:DNA-binding transcriptional ArsR family regulator